MQGVSREKFATEKATQFEMREKHNYEKLKILNLGDSLFMNIYENLA